MTDLNNTEKFLVRLHNGEGELSADDFLAALPDEKGLAIPWWQLVGFSRWHLAAAFSLSLVLPLAAMSLPIPDPLRLSIVVLPILVSIVFWRHCMFRPADDEI